MCKELAPLTKLPKLRELNVSYCFQTTEEAARKQIAHQFLNILKSMPKLQILWAE
jgi:hypothetical protein